MPLVHATILGGLPIVADVWFSGPDYFGEYDSGVDGLYWRRRDGLAGKRLSDSLMARVEKRDPHWESNVIEEANDWLMEHAGPDGKSPLYMKLNHPRNSPQTT